MKLYSICLLLSGHFPCVQVKQLVTKGLRAEQVCVLSYYSKQVQRIRSVLRQHNLSQVRRGGGEGGDGRVREGMRGSSALGRVGMG